MWNGFCHSEHSYEQRNLACGNFPLARDSYCWGGSRTFSGDFITQAQLWFKSRAILTQGDKCVHCKNKICGGEVGMKAWMAVPGTDDTLSEEKLAEAPKVKVLIIGVNSDSFLFDRASLEEARCECYFAGSHEEIARVVMHTGVDIVLGLNALQGLSLLMPLLASSRVSMFSRVTVEEGCWWLPVLRNGENCLGAAALRPREFSQVFRQILEGIITGAKTTGAEAI
jgi:hypothetical protein